MSIDAAEVCFLVITAETITSYEGDTLCGEFTCTVSSDGLDASDGTQMTLLGEGVMLCKRPDNPGSAIVLHRTGSANPFIGTWTAVLYYIGGVQQEPDFTVTFDEDEMCSIISGGQREDYIDCYYHEDVCTFSGMTGTVDSSGILILTPSFGGEDYVLILTRVPQ